MKKPELFDFFDLKKPHSHIAFLVFSILATIVAKLTGGEEYKSPYDTISIFVMVFIQIEVFIYFGNLLFGHLSYDKKPGEITRIIFFRFLVFIATCLLVSMILYIMLKYAVSGLTRGEDLSKVISVFLHDELFSWFKSTARGLSFGALIFIVLLWQTSLRREYKLKEENLIFQNETLKSQVNPHFLFNSLNTISSLIYSSPDTADRFINNLSSVYRYILENTNKDRVPVQAELNFVKDFYSLHMVRDEQKIILSVETPGAEMYHILPVSLQILLENAIKHNMATRENPLIIKIYPEDQYIVVENNLQRKATQLRSTGIGLRNLAERTKLVTGKDLIVMETNNSFIVKLPLIR